MAAAETLTVATDTFFCDGGSDISGHPRVYLTMKPSGQTECPYCGRHFVLALQAVQHAGH